MKLSENTNVTLTIGMLVVLLGFIVGVVKYHDTLEQREANRKDAADVLKEELRWMRQWTYVGAFPAEDWSKNYKLNHRWGE